MAAGAQSKYLIAGPPPSRMGSWRNSVAGVSPASVTSSAIATSGCDAEGRGARAAQPDLLLHARHGHHGRRHVALGEPAHRLDHHGAAGAVVDGLAREHARAVQRHARADERDRVADAHAERLGLLAARRAEVEEHLVQRDRLGALLGGHDVRGLGADDAEHGALRALHLQHLVGEHAVVVVADGREPHEALVLDVLHEEAELVHVRAQHEHRRALRAAPREVVIAERIARLLVRQRRKLCVHELGNLLLVAGDAARGVELEHEVEHPIGHRGISFGRCSRF